MEKNDKKTKPGLIEAHGGYRNLKSYQMTEIVYDATVLQSAHRPPITNS